MEWEVVHSDWWPTSPRNSSCRESLTHLDIHRKLKPSSEQSQIRTTKAARLRRAAPLSTAFNSICLDERTEKECLHPAPPPLYRSLQKPWNHIHKCIKMTCRQIRMGNEQLPSRSIQRSANQWADMRSRCIRLLRSNKYRLMPTRRCQDVWRNQGNSPTGTV